MIIDFHTHFWPDDLAARAIAKLEENMPGAKAFSDGTREGLLRSMDSAGITRAVTLPVATRPDQLATINAASAANRHERLIAFGAVHPLDPDMETTIASLKVAHVPGVKLHPEYQNFYVDDPSHDRMYDLLCEAGLFVVFHAGWDPGPFTRDHATPAALARVAKRFPHLNMIAAHMGGFRMQHEVERELAGLPIHIDTAAEIELLEPEEFARAARRHGVERVLFGTDSPWFSQKTALDVVLRSPLSQDDKERILWKNAAELLGGS